MPLTRKDAVTTLLLVGAVLVFYAYLSGTDLAIINDTRGALLVIGALGLGMCIVGGSAGYVGRNTYTTLQSVLGLAELAIVLIGLITTAEWTVMWLTIGVTVQWAAAIVYRLSVRPPVHGASRI
jgi:hypothetical protein